MRVEGRWAHGGLIVVALGVASNLALTFVPDVLPEPAAEVIVYCMTAVVIVVAPLWVYRELIESSRRLEEGRRRMRGIEAVGGDYSRESDVHDVWSAASEHVVCFGVGLTAVTKDVDHIVEAARRGVRVDFVMVDPYWLRSQRRVRALMDVFYDELAFADRVERAYLTIRSLEERLGREGAEGSVRLHTYRAWVQHSATIADPWSDEPKGYMEFHVFRRRPAWIRLVASGFDGPRGNRPYVTHILQELDRLLGYQLARARPM
ncbi:hypothetical protein GCM10010413_19380 [Promicromonospora sukumoe]|uniref:Uncharacterized protein n=1 Tax=Promicromonospora sukumoe TaxID=88382 RepID=A0A7W3PEF5_9MICO|nr:hypothetical protein [Promicromonospora sukumoe]MBA8808843.1 hypothetical protein [Promicromonospora sukumoe]